MRGKEVDQAAAVHADPGALGRGDQPFALHQAIGLDPGQRVGVDPLRLVKDKRELLWRNLTDHAVAQHGTIVGLDRDELRLGFLCRN